MKRTLSVFLALVMAATACTTIFASDAQNAGIGEGNPPISSINTNNNGDADANNIIVDPEVKAAPENGAPEANAPAAKKTNKAKEWIKGHKVGFSFIIVAAVILLVGPIIKGIDKLDQAVKKHQAQSAAKKQAKLEAKKQLEKSIGDAIEVK